MDTKKIENIMGLSTAVHDLMQGAGASPVKAHQTRVFKTVQGILARIDSLVDDEVTAEIKRLMQEASAVGASKGPVELTPPHPMTTEKVLNFGIGALGLPPRLHSPLIKAGVLKIRDMADLTIEQLGELDSVGPLGAEKIVEALQAFGLHLAQ